MAARPAAPLRFGRREFRCWLRHIALIVLCFLPLVPAGIAYVLLPAADEAILLLASLLLAGYAVQIILCFALPRWGLCFPAIATDRGMSFADSWSQTRRNTFRLLFGSVIAALPPALFIIVPNIAIEYLAMTGWRAPAAAHFIMGAINVVALFIEVAILSSFFSLAYRQLVLEPIETRSAEARPFSA